MTAPLRSFRVPSMVLAALLVGAVAPGTAEGHGRVFIGIGPMYPHPWVAAPDVPPPGWVPAHWERRYDRAGRPYDVWVPPHLR